MCVNIFNFFALFVFSINAVADLTVYEIDPFYNFFLKRNKQAVYDNLKVLNPEAIKLSNYIDAIELSDNTSIIVDTLRNETSYKGVLVSSSLPEIKLRFSIDLTNINKYLTKKNVDIKLVPSWYQAGTGTIKSKKKAFLTHELLINNDYSYSFSDSWRKKNKKWYYVPPVVNNDIEVTSIIAKYEYRRLLLELDIPEIIPEGSYTIYLDIHEVDTGSFVKKIPIEINVMSKVLRDDLIDKFDLFIYTNLSIDPKVGRTNTLINGQNMIGDFQYQKMIYKKSLEDIVDHGFNGVLVADWRLQYMDEVFQMASDSKVKNVIIYSKSPVEKNEKILNEQLFSKFREYEYVPMFYGYDEPGGNKKLDEQLELNKEINLKRGKSVNACFWKDRKNALNKSMSLKNSEFSYLNYSMGSNGSKKFLNSLPIDKLPTIRQLAYWHPHVENPIRNKLIMGFWLWSSGLDGLMPHKYMSLPHVSKVAINNKVAPDDLSPYNDFGYWSPPDIFRQHPTVYPKQGGLVSTLQWEGVKDGVSDLKLLLQLENSIQNSNLDNMNLSNAKMLLEEIKVLALLKDNSSLTLTETRDYMVLMKKWKKEIRLYIEKLN